MAEKNPCLRPAPEISNQGTVDLDDIHRQDLKMPQRGMPGAKIVECNTAPGITQRADKARRLSDVIQGHGFRDFDDEAARDVAAVAQQRSQRPQPQSITGRHPRYVQTKPHLRIGREILHGLVEHIAVDQADPAELFDDGDELATGDDAARLVAHPQQAFEIIDPPRHRADHRLERKKQAVLAERRLDRRPDSRPTPLAR